MQNDVANSGLGSYAGKHIRFAGITCSVLPRGNALGKLEETDNPQTPMTPSGLNVRYTNRFDDPTYYG